MRDQTWLASTAASYDEVATSYAGMFRDGLPDHPYVRGTLRLLAELVGTDDLPVLDAGCGTGLLSGYLHGLGVAVRGVDISPGMLQVARETYPHLPFDVGSMTDLAPVADASVSAVLAHYSVIRVPDEEMGDVLASFRWVLRPGGPVMVGFHVGDARRHKTEGYGGHRMNLHVHLRPFDTMTGWLGDAGFTVEARLQIDDGPTPGGLIVARSPG